MSLKILTLCSSFNRRDLTMRSLRSLAEAASCADVELINVVVDDGSTDGTIEALACHFPDVVVLRSHDLYWAGAMRFGYHEVAQKVEFDFLFAYNDDVEFYTSLFTQFLEARKISKGEVIVGETISGKCGPRTYGARTRRYWFYPLSFKLIESHESESTIMTFNMNALFISKNLLDIYGFLHESYIHSGADFDYGLHLSRHGVSINRCAQVIGECMPNDVGKKLYIWPSLRRVKLELSTKRQPLKQRISFCKRNGGRLWFVWVLVPYVRAFFVGRY